MDFNIYNGNVKGHAQQRQQQLVMSPMRTSTGSPMRLSKSLDGILQ